MRFPNQFACLHAGIDGRLLWRDVNGTPHSGLQPPSTTNETDGGWGCKCADTVEGCGGNHSCLCDAAAAAADAGEEDVQWVVDEGLLEDEDLLPVVSFWWGRYKIEAGLIV